MSQYVPQINWTPVKVICAVMGGALVIDSVSAVWGESRPVGSFFEELVARSVYWAMIAITFGSAIFVGFKVVDKTRSNLAGWGVGIGTFVVVGTVTTILTMNIPGVGWRFERLLNSQSEMEY